MTSSIANTSDIVIHCSRRKEYRSPFGAQRAGSYVDLAIDVFSSVDEVVLCYAYGLYDLSYSEMKCVRKEDSDRWTCHIKMPSEEGILFYWFCLRGSAEDIEAIVDPECRELLYRDHSEQQTYLYYVASWEGEDGKGKFAFSAPKVGVHEDKYPHAFQITVYARDFKTPDWMKGALMYQIFPDRFFRGSDYSYEKMTETGKTRPERIFHEDWNEEVDIHGKKETGYLACDFYGGTLKGIAEKADYLKDLQVDVLYLNPICEARSNHRYDTADYMNVDPILGGIPGYKAFSQKMHECGIRYIVDGVFSHTGADSRYFNKFGRYKETGAYESKTKKKPSKYSSWYSFWRTEDGSLGYDSWWGFPDLPNVRENDLSYRDYILGPDGVIANWLRGGASGVRLDVSDELPDSFLREMRMRVKESSAGDAMLLGEVWEEATTKISYGNYRDFALGRTHDAVMNYPFRDAVLSFLRGDTDARTFSLTMERYRENYPDEMYYCMMNLISSHDVPRAITVLAGLPDPGDREQQLKMKLDDKALAKGLALMRLAFLIQIMYPGAPCIYYGDELGMEGYRDPFNRRTYPWNNENAHMQQNLSFYKRLASLHQLYPVLKTGEIKMVYAKEDVLVFARFLDGEGHDHFGKVCQGPKKVLCILNRSDKIKMRICLGESGNSISIKKMDKSDSDISGAFETFQDEKILRQGIEVAPLSSCIFIYKE